MTIEEAFGSLLTVHAPRSPRPLSLAFALLLAACSSSESVFPGAGGTTGGGGGASAQGGGGSSAEGGGGAGGQGGAAAQEVHFGLHNAPDELYVQAAWLRLTLSVGDVVVRDAEYGSGVLAPIPVPIEIGASDVPEGTPVELLIERDMGSGAPILSQVARTTAVAGRALLYRVTLSDKACYGCDAPFTCNWGRCFDPHVAPEQLEDFTPAWASYSYCKPEAHGAPELELGGGVNDFIPYNDADVVDVFSGEQGGYHIFVGVRMRNLRQSSLVELRAYVPELGEDIGPLYFVSVLPDDPHVGYCRMPARIFQIDSQIPVSDLLGKTIELTGRISDSDGDAVELTKTLVLATEPVSKK